MKTNVSQKLEIWASNNNWSVSHPLDDERFWDFVIEAYKSEDTSIPEDDFYGIISKYYSDEDTLTEYYIKYQNSIYGLYLHSILNFFLLFSPATIALSLANFSNTCGSHYLCCQAYLSVSYFLFSY